jgi:fructuronate reductase
MTYLNKATLSELSTSVKTPSFDWESLPIGVVHFGPGAFHRAHQVAFFDAINETDPRFGICGVSLHSSGVRDALRPQDGLYSLMVLDEVITYQVMGSLREVLVAKDDPEAVFTRLISPKTQMVTTTVTEKGYCLKSDGRLDFDHADIVHDLSNPKVPKSVIGYITEGLRRRHHLGLKPFVVIPCDNLSNNGTKLKAALSEFALRVDPSLSLWINDQLSCPRTMVDSITPATDEDLRLRAKEALGVTDRWPVQREAFRQWVIERHDHENGPDWARFGIDLTDNVSAFERAKLRLLNAPHSALAYMGSIKGYESVSQAMQDPELVEYVHGLMRETITLLRADTPPQFDLQAYADAIIKRFKNPAIRHLLAQIAHDGSQKLPIRILSSITEALNQGTNIDRFVMTLAAWLRFIRHKALSGDTLFDPMADALINLAQTFDDSPKDIDRALGLSVVFPAQLAQDKTFKSALSGAYSALLD